MSTEILQTNGTAHNRYQTMPLNLFKMDYRCRSTHLLAGNGSSVAHKRAAALFGEALWENEPPKGHLPVRIVSIAIVCYTIDIIPKNE